MLGGMGIGDIGGDIILPSDVCQFRGKNLDHLLAKTVIGLCIQIVAKMTSHMLKYNLRYNIGIDVLTLSKVALQFTSAEI